MAKEKDITERLRNYEWWFRPRDSGKKLILGGCPDEAAGIIEELREALGWSLFYAEKRLSSTEKNDSPDWQDLERAKELLP